MFTTGLRSGGATCSAGVHGNGTAQAVCGRRHRRESVLPMQTRQPASSQVLRHVLLPPPAQQATVAMRAAADSDQPNNNTFSPADLHNPDDGWTQTSELVQGATVKFNDSAQRRAVMHWGPGCPSTVLIVKKPANEEATEKMREIAIWLASHKGIKVVAERPVAATEFPDLEAFDPQEHCVDFCVTLGGDGTVLHLASLFEKDTPLPPIISFAMGSLGFLTPFDSKDFAYYLTRVLSADNPLAPLYITLRSRRQCKLKHVGGRMQSFNALNEVVIDRGSSPAAVLLSVFTDGTFLTTIEADGLIISTPSGSTAYSMSAGGPMVAPSVPCSILTPIAPLSLSFRPLVIPESSEILIHLPDEARSHTARVSFDGKGGLRMRKGSVLRVTPAVHPIPMISMGMLDSDWYEAITDKLKWNQSLREFPRIPSTASLSEEDTPFVGGKGAVGAAPSPRQSPTASSPGRSPGPDPQELEQVRYIQRISKM